MCRLCARCLDKCVHVLGDLDGMDAAFERNMADGPVQRKYD